MNIATRIFFIFLTIFGMLSAIAVSISQLTNSQNQTTTAIEKLYNHHLLADKLRQTSDDLTRMARTYVMTGNEIYKQYYFEIIAIRDGKTARPENYDEAYWDFVTANERENRPRGPAVALINLMRDAGIKDRELAGLVRAKKHSDELSKMEKNAFGAMKGLFADSEGKLTINRTPDPDFAGEILHSPQYHEIKAEIMQPIREFLINLNDRIGVEISNSKNKEAHYRKITFILITATILFSLLTFVYFRRRVVNPIILLSKVAQRILSGELHERATVSGEDEIGSLNNAFNKMIEARIQVEFELKNNEQNLRTTLNSIGDALIATDIYGNVTRMNPIAEKLTGWQLNEAQGKPLSDIFYIINATTKKAVNNPVDTVLAGGKAVGLANHTTLISKDGMKHQIADSAAPIRDDDGDITGVVLVFRDVTEEYAVQEALHISEERYRGLFESADVALCNEDLTEVLGELNKLRKKGVTDLRQYLENNEQDVWAMAAMVKVVEVNDATLKLFSSKTKEGFFGKIDETFGHNAINIFIDELCAIWDKKKSFRAEANFRDLNGEDIHTIISFQIPETEAEFDSIPFSIIDITELKKAETELRKSEERYKSLFEYAEVAICNEDMSSIKIELDRLRDDGITDIRQYLEDNTTDVWHLVEMIKVIHVNKATLKLFESVDDSDFIRQFDKTFGPNAIDTFIDGLCAIWDKKEVFRAVVDFRTLKGKIINAIISYPIPKTLDGFKSVPFSIIDITELKMAETAHRKSEELLSLHLKNTPLGVISWDRQFNCVQWNPAAEKIFGFSAEEALGKHATKLMVPEGMDDELEAVLIALLSQTGGTHDVSKNVTKDGSTIDCEWFNTPLVGADGNIMGIASMVQDITKHKTAEDELRKLSRAVEQSPASISITDTDGIIEYVNPKFEEATGYTAAEVIGRNPRFLRSGHTSEKEYKALWDTIRAGKKWRGELQNKRKDGSYFWELTFISPILAEDGTVTHFLAAKEDITERKQLEGHLRKSQKMEAVGELAGGIAHDFNNLLGVIIGNLDLMKRKVEDGGKLQKQLEKAQNAALRGSSLTRRLLNFSHQAPEAGSPANVNKIIRSLEDLVGKSLTSKISLGIDLADDLWMVELNTGDFEDTLINFSLNARDAMPNGGQLFVETKNKTITQSTSDYEENFLPGEYVEIIISDTGHGIPKDTIPKIFDPFFTTKEKDKGTGLGLSMIYGFIQRTKGYISVYSEEGVGTTFKIYLPRSLTTTERMKPPIEIKEVLPVGTETILIVDDEEELTFIAKNILEELGYTAICAYNSDEALKILEDNKIHLLFSDIVMAGSMNGFNLAEMATKLYPGLKILLTSGFAGKIQTSEEIEKWGKKMIAKPYRNAELANRIRATLDKKD